MLANNDIRTIAKLFVSEGIDVSIRKIAEEISTSHTKLLRTYSSKENLQIEVLENVFGNFIIYIISHNVKRDVDGNWKIRTDRTSEDMYQQSFLSCVDFGRTSEASLLILQLLGRPSKLDMLKKSMIGALRIASQHSISEWDLFSTPEEGEEFLRGITERTDSLGLQTHFMLHISVGLMMATSANEVLLKIFERCIDTESANKRTNSKMLTGQMVKFLRHYTICPGESRAVKN